MAADAWWEIRNGDNECVCRRGTKRECVELLEGYAFAPPTHKGWNTGPYSVWRMTAERRYVHRSLPSEGDPHG